MARSDRRAELLEGACAYVLEHPIGTLSLRPLAAALGTSDRMLVYHFRTREDLLSAVLDQLGGRLRGLLEAAMTDERIAPHDALQTLVRTMGDPQADPILRLWFEMCGLAARGVEPFAAEVARVSESWIDWLSHRLDVEAGSATVAAVSVLSTADGLALIRATTGRDSTEAAAAIDIPGRVRSRGAPPGR